jgi:aarF domain-containing kinase
MKTVRSVAALSVGATIASQSYQAISFADVGMVKVLQPPAKKVPKMIAKSVYVEEEKVERSALIAWVSKYSQKLLDHFAAVTGTCSDVVRYLHRFLTIAIITSPMAVLAPLAYFLGNNFPSLQDLAMRYGVWAMEALGPAFVKMGQWASTRPDLYPPHVVARLAALQDDVSVHYPMETVEATLTEALGEGWKDILKLDPKPIGAGCIAQVFKGELNSATEKGEKVAVKVIHPHVKHLLKTDMELLTFLAHFMDAIPSLELLSIGEACRGFCRSMNEQLDMRKEAYNLIHFGKKFEKETWAVFPRPIQDLTTSNVLVETLMEGTNINKFMEMKEEVNGVIDQSVKELKMKLSDICGKTMIKMIFFDNFIHGDLHPGNILVNFNESGEPRLVLLDTGIVFTAKDEEDHSRLVDVCLAFMQHDGRRAARLMLDEKDAAMARKAGLVLKAGEVTSTEEKGNVLSEEDINPEMLAAKRKGAEGFIEGVQDLVDAAEQDSYFEHIGEYVARMCDLARVNGVKLNPGYFHIAMALKVTEGISLALDRELDMISTILPVILKAKALQKLGVHDIVFGDIDTEEEAKKMGFELRPEKK